MSINIMKIINNAIKNTKRDIEELGGKKTLRGKLGTESHLKWRLMYNLENELPKNYLQSPEVKLTKRNKTDLAIFRIENGKFNPEVLIELKMTTYNNLFDGKKEIEKDYTKLISVVESLQIKELKTIPKFGLIFYLESKGNFTEYLAKTGCPTLFKEYKHLLPNYFEFIIREVEGDVVNFNYEN